MEQQSMAYDGRYRFKVLVIGKEFGGETAKAGAIENYPRFESIDGFKLINAMKKQAEKLGVEMLNTDDGLVLDGFRHYRINHDTRFANQQSHINGIENFWGCAKD